VRQVYLRRYEENGDEIKNHVIFQKGKADHSLKMASRRM
jgi:hypothetical protein